MVPSPAPGDKAHAADDYVPEPAMTEKHYENYHTGRGGQGNVHMDRYGGHSGPKEEQGSLIDRAKHAMGMGHKKEGEGK